MSCSIIGDRVRLHLEHSATTLSMLAGAAPLTGSVNRWRSALQNPELNQCAVDNLLRQAGKPKAAMVESQRGWSDLIAAAGARCANANGGGHAEIS